MKFNVTNIPAVRRQAYEKAEALRVVFNSGRYLDLLALVSGVWYYITTNLVGPKEPYTPSPLLTLLQTAPGSRKISKSHT